MSLYKIEYKKLTAQLLPVVLRKPRLLAWLWSIITGVENIYDNFVIARNERLRRIKSSGQVCVLEGMLNDEADNEQRRIQIFDGQIGSNWMYAYREAENFQEIFTPDEVPGEDFMVEISVFFTVSVPWSYGTNDDAERRIKWLLNNYKLAGKKYVIKYT
jgi:hypothetical protein